MKPRGHIWVMGLMLGALFTISSSLNPQASKWTTPRDLGESLTIGSAGYPFLICDPYQNLHIFWADNAEDGAAVFYRNDIDGFLSKPNDILSLPGSTIYYLTGVIIPRAGQIILSWTLPDGSLYVSQAPLARSVDAKAWLNPIKLDYGVFNSSLGVDSQGNVHLVYAVMDNDDLEISVIHRLSQDGGLSWTRPAPIFKRLFTQAAYGRVEIAISTKDILHVGVTFRSQAYGTFSEVGYLRSSTGGTSWSSYLLVDDTSETFQGVEWIAPYVFGDQEVHLTWHDPRRMHIWSADGGNTWTEPEEMIKLGGAFGGPNDLVQDSLGNIHLLTAVRTGVYSAIWNRNIWGVAEVIDDRDIDPHYQQMTVCGGNRLHVVYHDQTGSDSVWYSSRQVEGPSIPRESIPVIDIEQVSTPVSELRPAETLKPVETPTPLLFQADNSIPAEPTVSQIPVMGISTAVVVILITIAAAVQKLGKK